jgi:hypothetical protein
MVINFKEFLKECFWEKMIIVLVKNHKIQQGAQAVLLQTHDCGACCKLHVNTGQQVASLAIPGFPFPVAG